MSSIVSPHCKLATNIAISTMDQSEICDDQTSYFWNSCLLSPCAFLHLMAYRFCLGVNVFCFVMVSLVRKISVFAKFDANPMLQ